jgi:pimeloyl-ACP methyl ester carboxylesterase
MADQQREQEPVTSRRGYFWVGIELTSAPYGTVPRGQMYVEWEAPVDGGRPYPVVLIHGGGGQGLDYLGTPDGRPGWASQLVREGYTVYVVDRPGHGRSPFHPDALGTMGPMLPLEAAHGLFAPPKEGEGSHPLAKRHTQWPGTAELDDPALLQQAASSGPMMADFGVAHALEQRAGAELLDRIGPAVVVTSSAGGPGGWLLADARPELVKALVALETIGPPFADLPLLGVSLVWGLTAAPITYDPTVADPSELELVERPSPVPGGPPLTLQADPPRRLPNLSRVPIAYVSAEASLFRSFDAHTVEFLRQAGCDADLVRLEDHGVRGNGHAMMVERNNREVLGIILDWLARKLPAAGA